MSKRDSLWRQWLDGDISTDEWADEMNKLDPPQAEKEG